MSEHVEPLSSKRLLQWIQQQAGVSRRKAQELIAAGEVSVDGKPATDPFCPLDRQHVRRIALRGHPLSLDPIEPRVYRFHKPTGMLCSNDDRFSGNTVGRVLRAEGFIGYAWAGRLDQDAEGLLVVTNDGDLINALTHPRYEVEKTYHVWLRALPSRSRMTQAFAAMKKGVVDRGDRLCARDVHVVGRPPYVRITLSEGKKHEIKRLFAHFDLDITRLLRVSMGSITLGTLAPQHIERLSRGDEEHAFAQVDALMRRVR